MNLNRLKLLIDFLEIDYIKHILSNLGIELKKNEENHSVINKLYREIINNNILEDVILLLDENCLGIIEKIAKNVYIKPEQNDSFLMYYNALSDYGLLLKIIEDDRIYYTIASEVYDMITKIKQKIQSEFNINKIIFKFAKSAVAYYGLLDQEETMELFKFYHRYSHVDIFPRLHFYTKLQTIFTYNGEYLFDNNIIDIDKFVKDKEHFNSLPLYKYTFDQFYVDEHYLTIDVDVDLYYEITDYFKEKIECDPSIIVAIYYFLMYEYNVENLKDIIEKETVVDVSKIDKRFDQYIKKLYPYVRCWVLKGHMVSEVNEMISENPKLYLKSDFVLLKKVEQQIKKRRLFG